MKKRSQERVKRKRLLILEPAYPYRDTWDFIEDEVLALPTLAAAKRYDQVEFVAVPVISAPASRARKSANWAKAVLLDGAYHPIQVWGGALLRLLSCESLRELWQARKEITKPGITLRLKRLLQYFATASRLLLYIDRTHDPTEEDLTVYSYWLTETAYAAAKVKRVHPSVTTISRCHGSEVHPESVYIPLRAETHLGLDAIFFVAEDRRVRYQLLLDGMGMRNENDDTSLLVSRLGLPPAQLRATAREAPGPQGAPIRILSVSSIIPVKRLDRILDALALIDEPVSWTHVGSGPLEEDLARRAQDLVAARTDLEVHFLGSRPRSEVLSILREGRFDFIVNTSESEGVPVSIMEAFAQGLPALALDVGGVREAVQSGRNGALLPSDASAADIAVGITDLGQALRKERVRNALKKGAIATAREAYDLHHNLEGFYGVLANLETTGAARL